MTKKYNFQGNHVCKVHAGTLTALWVLTEQTWPDFNQITYLLSRPLTCPIYVLSGGFPGDSPTADDIIGNTWFC